MRILGFERPRFLFFVLVWVWFVFIFSLAGCGRAKAQKEALYVHEKWQMDNLAALKAVTPAESPLAPGIVTIADAQAAFLASMAPYLPKPEEIAPAKLLPAVPFVEADATAKKAAALAIAAGAGAEEGARVGKAAADEYVWKPAALKLDPALKAHLEEAEAAYKPIETGWIGKILNGVGTVAGLFGPIGAVASVVLGLAGLFFSKEAKKAKEQVTALVTGIEKTVQAAKKDGIFSEAAKNCLYGNITAARAAIPSCIELGKKIDATKDALRKG